MNDCPRRCKDVSIHVCCVCVLIFLQYFHARNASRALESAQPGSRFGFAMGIAKRCCEDEWDFSDDDTVRCCAVCAVAKDDLTEGACLEACDLCGDGSEYCDACRKTCNVCVKVSICGKCAMNSCADCSAGICRSCASVALGCAHCTQLFCGREGCGGSCVSCDIAVCTGLICSRRSSWKREGASASQRHQSGQAKANIFV